MADVSVTPDQFAAALGDIMQDLVRDTTDVVGDSARTASRRGAKRLRDNRGAGPRQASGGQTPVGRRSKYVDGWTSSEEKSPKPETVTANYVIHNKAEPTLTHLLDRGHANLLIKGWSKAYPHIEQTREYVEEQFMELTEMRINKVVRGTRT